MPAVVKTENRLNGIHYFMDVDISEGNAAQLILEFLADVQQSLPQTKLRVEHKKGANYRCRLYIDGNRCSRVEYERFADYINANLPTS